MEQSAQDLQSDLYSTADESTATFLKMVNNMRPIVHLNNEASLQSQVIGPTLPQAFKIQLSQDQYDSTNRNPYNQLDCHPQSFNHY